jgi:quercetin dioxygenase-like cupin family protein
MTSVHAENAETFEMQKNLMTKLVAPSTGAKEIMAWRGKMQAGAARPPHIHEHEEVLVILAGTVKVKIGDEEHILRAGDAFEVPPHTIRSPD